MKDLTKVDFHSHTYYSLLRVPKLRGKHFFQDSAISPKLLVKVARRRKLGGIALTDHDNMRGIKPFLDYASKFNDITPIVGQEITKYDQKGKGWAHILTYGMREIPKKLRFRPLTEFLDYLDDNNAVYVLAHPFDLSQSAPAGGYIRKTYEINFSVLKRLRMIEVINGLQPKRHNYLAQIISRELGIPGIAGGDSHQPKMIGRCFTYVEGTTEDEILEYLRKVKKSPSKYQIQTHGVGGDRQIWSEWVSYLLWDLEYNIRYDIYRHLNPKAKGGTINPIYEKSFYDKPIIPKIIFRAAIPYIFWALLAGLRIWVPRMEKMTRERELKVLKSLIDHQEITENGKVSTLELPISEEDFAILEQS
jgi:predicted metal-dependent phosphoesterase TrpH